MPRKSRDEYDLRPSMQDKPNSQGTLFRAPVSARKPEARQPRGYSPQRMAEVREATDGNIKAPRRFEADSLYQDLHAHADKRAKFRLQETLARSAVDTSSIKGVNNWRINDDDMGHDEWAKHTGWPADPGVGRWEGTSTISVARGQEIHSDTIAHEVHHSINFRSGIGQERHGDAYGTGLEEGEADDYGKAMSRKPGYKNREEFEPSGYEHYATDPDNRHHDFSQGYLLARNMLHNAPQPDKGKQERLF